MRVIKQYENENYNPVYIIETGEKRKSYYKFVTYRGNVLRQNETIYKFVYTKRNFLITYNEYRDFKSAPSGSSIGCRGRRDDSRLGKKAEASLEIVNERLASTNRVVAL